MNQTRSPSTQIKDHYQSNEDHYQSIKIATNQSFKIHHRGEVNNFMMCSQCVLFCRKPWIQAENDTIITVAVVNNYV